MDVPNTCYTVEITILQFSQSFKIIHLWLALLCMTCFHMSYEITLVCTSIGAKRTNKWLLPSVLADVYGEFGFTDGLVTAHLALIISSAPFL